jgi:predicted site-specific integrase-resolvase
MTPLEQSPPLLTESEAARILAVKPATLRRWRWSGDGPPFRRTGACVRYHPDDIKEFIEAATRRSTSDPGGEANER